MMYCCIGPYLTGASMDRWCNFGAFISGGVARVPGRLVARKLSSAVFNVKASPIFLIIRPILGWARVQAFYLDIFYPFAYDSYRNHKCDAPNPSVQRKDRGKAQWGESPRPGGE